MIMTQHSGRNRTIFAAYPDCPISLINRENMTEFVQDLDSRIDR